MPFICPDCSQPELHITHSIELPPDSRSDEITLQIVRCAACGFDGIVVYEESRRGALGTESFDHTGYRTNDEPLQTLRDAIAQCPDPHNPRCGCSTHRSLSRTEAAGRWAGLPGIKTAESFTMRPG